MPDAHRVIVVIENGEGKSPYEIWLLAALCLGGILFLLGLSPPPESVEAGLPPISRLIWNIQLVTGTAAALIGMFWKQPTVGRTIQIAGNLWAGSGALIYSSVLFYFNGAAATLVGLVVGSIAFAAMVKTFQLRRQIRTILNQVGEQNVTGRLDDSTSGNGSSR